jgi:hypothetical protein
VAFSGTMAIGAAARAYFIGGASLADTQRLFRRGRRRGKGAKSKDSEV